MKFLFLYFNYFKTQNGLFYKGLGKLDIFGQIAQYSNWLKISISIEINFNKNFKNTYLKKYNKLFIKIWRTSI